MKKNIILGMLVTLCIGIIAYTDLVLQSSYIVKTMIKAPIFFFVPLVYSKFYPSYKPFNILISNLKGLKLSLILGIGIYIIIVLFYLVANSLIDLSSIKTSLETNLGINKNNFIAIALYVCFCNSFLEEWFFRGFIFTEYKKSSRLLGYLVSSSAFGLYHIAIMDGMFSPVLLIIVLLGLFIGGCIFNYLNEKNSNLYSSWFCHLFANLAMNTVGYLIFFT